MLCVRVRSIAMSVHVSVCLCLSVRVHVSNHTPKFTKFSMRVIRERGSIILWRQWKSLCTFGCVDDVMFSHNGLLYGVWCWQYLPESRSAASSHEFPTYSPGAAKLPDLVSDDDMRGAATGWWPAACGIKAVGEVCCFSQVTSCAYKCRILYSTYVNKWVSKT